LLFPAALRGCDLFVRQETLELVEIRSGVELGAPDHVQHLVNHLFAAFGVATDCALVLAGDLRCFGREGRGVSLDKLSTLPVSALVSLRVQFEIDRLAPRGLLGPVIFAVLATNVDEKFSFTSPRPIAARMKARKAKCVEIAKW
jgi:hypothetical protein